jgi:hypothetical protein
VLFRSLVYREVCRLQLGSQPAAQLLGNFIVAVDARDPSDAGRRVAQGLLKVAVVGDAQREKASARRMLFYSGHYG